MSRRTPRGKECILIGMVVGIRCTLYALLVWPRSLRPPLVDIEELFSHTFNSLIHNFQSKKIRALIYGVVLLINQAYIYKIQWKFISRVASGASKAEDN